MNNNRFERSIQDLNLWISKNLEGFSPNCWINGNEDLISTIKKFAELLYIDNMFYPVNVFGEYSIEIEALVKKPLKLFNFKTLS
ncbi:hypothetical protein [Lacticaseibacillus sharpeae]|uniref:hypothetical protein n=1 Tax=Lacticaseibacillus sharpeae TaxID=1626 RepID=UPI0006D06653|nr:hypothetical protein [Lacticaseibacillus sharpeae]